MPLVWVDQDGGTLPSLPASLWRQRGDRRRRDERRDVEGNNGSERGEGKEGGGETKEGKKGNKNERGRRERLDIWKDMNRTESGSERK